MENTLAKYLGKELKASIGSIVGIIWAVCGTDAGIVRQFQCPGSGNPGR